MLPAPVEVPEPEVVAGVEATEELVKVLGETIDEGLVAELATLVGKAVPAWVDEVGAVVAGLPKPKVGAYEEPN